MQAEHFGYWDLTNRGVKRWMEINASHRRAIAPLMSHLYLSGLPIEAQMSHIGACLEALRFAELLREGQSRQAASQEPIKVRVQHLVELAAEPVASLVGDSQKWSQAFALAYNAVKHASRDPVDPADTFWLVRSGALVSRTRLLQSAGVPDSAFARLTSSSWWHPMKEGVAEVLLQR